MQRSGKSIILTTYVVIWLSIATSMSGQPHIPSNDRSRQVTARVRPILEQDMESVGLRFGASIYMRIFKEEHELELWVQNDSQFVLYKTYPVCCWSGTLGPKLQYGDFQAPEGFYYTKPSSLNPYSAFHLSFNTEYPNLYDQLRGRTGSAIMVHGNCVSIGCFAMTDPGIEDLYTLADGALRNGQPFFRIHIFPFRMNRENMEKHNQSEWYSFWENLKEGYDYFEEHNHTPPNVDVKNLRYIFN